MNRDEANFERAVWEFLHAPYNMQLYEKAVLILMKWQGIDDILEASFLLKEALKDLK